MSSSHLLNNELLLNDEEEEDQNMKHLLTPAQEPANHRPMSMMQTIINQPKNLVKLQRRRAYFKVITKKWISLLLSPRTLLVQLLACFCIFLVTKFDEVNKYTKHIGTSISLRVITMLLVFCIVFGINQSFARRERTLQDIAGFKSSITTLYYTMGCLDGVNKEQIFELCAALFWNLNTYIYDRNELLDNKLHSHQQTIAMQNFYADINKLLRCVSTTFWLCDCCTYVHNRIITQQESEVGHRVMPFLSTKVNITLTQFERICATKDYLSPIGIRAFTDFVIWLLAVLLAPYFVWHTNEKVDDLAAYTWAWTYFLMLGFLIDINDMLHDCFDNDSLHDDIVLDVEDILRVIKQGACQK